MASSFGYFLKDYDSKTSIRDRSSASEGIYKKKYENLKNKFDQLNNVDFDEYLNLKNQKEKYEKADEILGKILLIFLSDLGLRVTDKKIEVVKSHLVVDQRSEATSRRSSDGGHSKSEIKTEAASETKSHVSSNAWTKNEKNIEQVTSELEGKDFLNSVVIDDLFRELKYSKNLNQDQLLQINGSFTGRIAFDNKSKTSWEVELELDGYHKDGKAEGKCSIILSKEGRSFSHTSGNGDLRNFKAFAGKSKAILVSANSDRGVFQLYFPSNINTLIGNYYHKQSIGKYKKTGTVTLTRR